MSAIIRHRETGRAICELFSPKNIELARKNLKPEYEIVEAGKHLAELSDPTKPAYHYARRFEL